MTYNIAETDFQGYEVVLTDSLTLKGAIMRAYAEIWAWAQVQDINEVAQYTHTDGSIRVVPKTDGIFWDHGVVVRPITG